MGYSSENQHRYPKYPKIMIWKMYPLSNMAIFGVHVNFRGGGVYRFFLVSLQHVATVGSDVWGG